MNKVTLRLGIHRIASLALFCFSLSACTAVACSQHTTPDRTADAGAICRDTMGLSPSNVPFESCVQSLLQNETSAPAMQIAAVDLPESATRKSCAQFGLKSDSKALDSCAANLDASLFEAVDVAAR